MACTPAPQTPPPPSTTLKLLSWQAPTILNPHLSAGFKDAEASRISLEPLASFDAEGKLVPFLAAEIPTLDNGGLAKDGRSVVWKLKKNIRWSDGTPFTAQDVVFTYQFITNPQVGATSLGNYETVQRVVALDGHTVQVFFKEANAAWFLPFVGGEGMILPRHAYQAYPGDKARQAPANLLPIGTGPYRVTQFKPGDVVLYEANPYFREAKTLAFQGLELKGGGDAVSAARAVLQTGDADFAFNLQVEGPLLDDLQRQGKGQVVSHLGSLGERIIFNFTNPRPASGPASNFPNPHPFLQDPKVREALTLAIDRDTIAKQLYGITGSVATNLLLAPAEYVSHQTRYHFDLDRAAALLEQAGWRDSNGNGTRDKQGVELQLVFQTSVNPLRQKTQQVIKQGLQAIGVGVELKAVDPSVMFSSDPANPDTLERFSADLLMFTTGNTNPDPSKYLQTFTCGTIPQAKNNWVGDNFGRYCNPEYDRLWQQASQERNLPQRQQRFIRLNDLLVNNFVAVPLVHRADVVAVSRQLQGVALTPWDRNTWNIKDWRRPQP
ncbi:oligopeptide binding protein of ABC transporter [Synechocystis sp. LKSZ1]